MSHVLFSYYVPADGAQLVQDACFKAGAGKIGNYIDCSWHTLGYGQFKPQPGANPKVGEINKTFHETIIKVEIICQQALWPAIEKAFLEAHPYETPAYFITPILNAI
jgi:structural hemagglutinin/hemolysin toxin protein RtxA